MIFSSLRIPTLCALLGCSTFISAAELAREKDTVDGKAVTVSARKELTFKARSDEDIKHRELWYARRANDGWLSWEKHPLEFSRQTPIRWEPPEGHWRVYIRLVEISGLSMPVPQGEPETSIEFIIDRTAPTVRIIEPANNAILSTGKPLTITWEAEDPHIHSKPISLYWARSENDEPVAIVENIPNSGSYKWTTPQDMSNDGRIIIKAADKALNSSQAQNSGIIVDGVAPQRNILGPVTSQSRQINVAISVLDPGPAKKVADAQLWYSADNGANWVAGPKITQGFEQITWDAPGDGEYLLNLVCTDIAGNANPSPSSARDSLATILVDTAAPTITLSAAVGVADAGADATGSRTVFKPGDKVQVPFSIDDMRLADKPVSVSFQSSPDAPWEVLAEGLPANQVYEFIIPDVNSRNCRVKVSAIDATGNIGSAQSSEPFTIDNEVSTGEVEVEL